MRRTIYPPDVRPASNADAATWIVEALSAARADRSVASLVPGRFDAYVRILHPAYISVGGRARPVSWSEIAGWSGRSLVANSRFGDIAAEDAHGRAYSERPAEGDTPGDIVRILIGHLELQTSTPEQCWFARWVGYGPAVPWVGDRRAESAVAWESAGVAATFGVPGREFHLFEGKVDAAGSFGRLRTLPQSPTIWWPEDRRWCVSTGIDTPSTYVGGATGCVAALLEDERLECFQVGPADPLA